MVAATSVLLATWLDVQPAGVMHRFTGLEIQAEPWRIWIAVAVALAYLVARYLTSTTTQGELRALNLTAVERARAATLARATSRISSLPDRLPRGVQADAIDLITARARVVTGFVDIGERERHLPRVQPQRWELRGDGRYLFSTEIRGRSTNYISQGPDIEVQIGAFEARLVDGSAWLRSLFLSPAFVQTVTPIVLAAAALVVTSTRLVQTLL